MDICRPFIFNRPSVISTPSVACVSFIKDWFRHEDNKTGCRFIVVDAYNEDKVLRYYEKNGFVPLYKTEEIEKQYYDIPQDEHLKTRLLYFDLKKK